MKHTTRIWISIAEKFPWRERACFAKLGRSQDILLYVFPWVSLIVHRVSRRGCQKHNISRILPTSTSTEIFWKYWNGAIRAIYSRFALYRDCEFDEYRSRVRFQFLVFNHDVKTWDSIAVMYSPQTIRCI